GEPQRRVAERLEIMPRVVDLKSHPRQEAELAGRMRGEARRPFVLDRGPLLRVTLYQLRPNEHVVLLVMHHIVSDGWSMSVLLGELTERYRCYRDGSEPQLE